jgi:4-hydroxybenzoate polyprenyltransferase
VEKFHTEALLYTVPFVAYGIFRYLYLVKVEGASEDPSQVLFTDRPLLLAIVLWALTVAVILYRP